MNIYGARRRSFVLFVIFAETKKDMTQQEKTQIEERIVDVLKTVYDPEIPVNIWDLGMIYKILEDNTRFLEEDFSSYCFYKFSQV